MLRTRVASVAFVVSLIVVATTQAESQSANDENVVPFFPTASASMVGADAEVMKPGRTVRFHLSGQENRVEGIVESITSAGMVVRQGDGSIRTCTGSDVLNPEVLVTRRRTGRGALIGGAIGLGLGLSIPSDEGYGRGIQVMGLPIAGLGLGALIGAGIKTSRWVPGMYWPGPQERATESTGWLLSMEW